MSEPPNTSPCSSHNLRSRSYIFPFHPMSYTGLILVCIGCYRLGSIGSSRLCAHLLYQQSCNFNSWHAESSDSKLHLPADIRDSRIYKIQLPCQTSYRVCWLLGTVQEDRSRLGKHILCTLCLPSACKGDFFGQFIEFSWTWPDCNCCL